MEVENLSFKATAAVSRLELAKSVFNTGRKVIYIAPTRGQARNIVWAALLNKLGHVATRTNETLLEMDVPNEDKETTTIMVGGWENRENYRGLTDVIHITVDETDTMRDFFQSWREIFRPMFLDTGGTANFIGTPKKESKNIARLEHEFKDHIDWGFFHFTSRDNPFLPVSEIDDMEAEYANDRNAYRQEVLAEYVEDTGALFSYSALVDVFSNTITKSGERYLIVDIADDGSDKTVFSLWDGLEEYKREEFARLNTETIIAKIREIAAAEQVPYSHIAVDAIGVGAAVASSSMLDGIIGYKSSYSPIKTDQNIVLLPNQSLTSDAKLTSDYKNLRSQCVFTLADLVNNHKIASRVDGQFKELILEELQAYQDASKGDGKRFATPKEDVKEMIGRSPDHSDTWLMRMYFEIMGRMTPGQSPESALIFDKQFQMFSRNRGGVDANSAR